MTGIRRHQDDRAGNNYATGRGDTGCGDTTTSDSSSPPGTGEHAPRYSCSGKNDHLPITALIGGATKRAAAKTRPPLHGVNVPGLLTLRLRVGITGRPGIVLALVGITSRLQAAADRRCCS